VLEPTLIRRCAHFEALRRATPWRTPTYDQQGERMHPRPQASMLSDTRVLPSLPRILSAPQYARLMSGVQAWLCRPLGIRALDA
jgi:hypothetical protein